MQAHRIFGGTLLVSGTTIGAAMLALPVSTGLAGFFPSLVLMVAVWLYLTYTAFLILEVNLTLPRGSNMISMATLTLGVYGKVAAWIAYLLLLYALNTAYISGGASLFGRFLAFLLGKPLPTWASAIPLLLIFGSVVYRGTAFVDRVNRLLMAGVFVAFAALTVGIVPSLDTGLLFRQHWGVAFLGLSVIVTSFGFHIIIPSLVHYLDGDVTSLRRVIWYGTAIPVILFCFWELLCIGTVPVDGPGGILEAYRIGANGAEIVSQYTGRPWLITAGACFTFFAIITSMIGVSLSLNDFLADGLNVPPTVEGKILLNILTFCPPLALTLTNPRAFLSALEFAGAYGVATLLGLLPPLMVWRVRYYQRWERPYQVPGGKGALFLAMVASFFIIALEAMLTR